MQKPCTCEFLYGTLTTASSKNQLSHALSLTEETQVVVLLYKKDGSNFLCNILIAPVKNEKSEIILFILNFDELSDASDNKFSRSKTLKSIRTTFKLYLKLSCFFFFFVHIKAILNVTSYCNKSVCHSYHQYLRERQKIVSTIRFAI